MYSVYGSFILNMSLSYRRTPAVFIFITYSNCSRFKHFGQQFVRVDSWRNDVIKKIQFKS